MKRNSDRDIIIFHNEVTYEEGTDVSTGKKSLYVKSMTGPTCEKYQCKVGSASCKNCPYCYGIKTRWWMEKSTGAISTNGYVKCSMNNDSFVNKVKCLWWRIRGKRIIVKDLENE